MLVGSFAKLSKHIEGYFDLMGSMNKLGHLFDLPLERTGRSPVIDDSDHLAEIHDARFVPCFQAERSPSKQRGTAEVLRLNPGQNTAVFGESLSGKSRLADALYGLDVSAEGLVSIRGISVRDLRTEELRRKVALIRDVEILAATIEENIHLGRTEVDAAAIHEGLMIAGLYDELNELPLGLRTELVCGGEALSDSQSVRLMIARAVAGHPELLVIDGLLDRLSDDLLDPLLSRLQSSNVNTTLLVFTGRQDLAQRFFRSWKLIPYQANPS
jgi:ABC-type transport system involved in cytochrome bd biosynthesis fused ATPase/permease subunit